VKKLSAAFFWLRRLILAASIVMLSACGGSVELMAAIPESEANELLAVLLNAGISAHKQAGKEGMVSLHVENGRVANALDALRARGLPRERYSGMGEVFRKEGLISSPLEERVRYLYALAQELSNTISKIDGVMVARVHVVLPERGSAGDASTPSSAAVFIKYQEGYNLDTVQPQIRRLVTNSIPNLTAEKVAVIMVASQGAESAATAGSAERAQVVPAALQATAQPLTGASEGKRDTVMGIEVGQSSAGTLIALLVGMGVLALGGLIVLGRAAWKHLVPRLGMRGSAPAATAKPAKAGANDRLDPAEMSFDEAKP